MGRRTTNNTAKDNSKKWLVALYIRLSREDGNDVSYSVINQEKKLKDYLANMDEDVSLVKVYIDDGATGTDSDREQFQEMLKDIEAGKINCVIVKDLSRLSRNYLESGQYLEYYFVKNNVRFISLDLPRLDSYKDPASMESIMVPIQSVFNDNFARETSLKVRSTFHLKRSRGEFIGAFAPYGYQKDPNDKNKFIIDTDVCDVVRDIFSWYIDGISKSGIARKLNELGIPNPIHYKKSIGSKYANPHDRFEKSFWTIRTIDEILKNEMYIGTMVQGRNKTKSYKVHERFTPPKSEWFIVPNKHEPIVSKETFQKVQELMKKNTRTAPGKKEVYMFGGLLRCADCHKAMTRKKGKRNFYICRTYNDVPRECTRHKIFEDELSDAVLTAINTQLAIMENLDILLKEVANSPQTRKMFEKLNKAISTQEEKINKVNKIRDSLYADWKLDLISQDDYIRMKISYDEQLVEIKEQLKSLKEQLMDLNGSFQGESSFFSYYKQFKQIDKIERSILLELIDTIYIHEGSEIEVHFKFQNQINNVMQLLDDKKVKIKNYP